MKIWRKSTRSNEQSACLELSNGLDEVRDSKNPAGPTMTADLTPLVRAAKAGRLDR